MRISCPAWSRTGNARSRIHFSCPSGVRMRYSDSTASPCICLRKQRMGPLQVVGMDRLRPGHRVLVEALAGPAPNLFICRADIEHLVGCRGASSRRLREYFPPAGGISLRCSAGPARLACVGDVRTEADVAQELTARGKAWLRVGGHPPPLAIGTPDARFGPERCVFPHRALERRRYTGAHRPDGPPAATCLLPPVR